MEHPGNSIYPGALVGFARRENEKGPVLTPIVRSFDSWTHLKDPGKKNAGSWVDRQVLVNINDVGIVVEKCPNDVIRSPERTWVVLFGLKLAIVRQSDLQRVSFSWKESQGSH